MPKTKSIQKTTNLNEKFLNSIEETNDIIVESEEENKGIHIASLTGYPIYYLGPPGWGKTFRAEFFTAKFSQAKFFYRQCFPTMTDAELLGSLDPAALMQGQYQRNSEDTLLDAHFAMFDEVFNGNDAPLLAVQVPIERKVFREQGRTINMPLRLLIMASNHLPDEERMKVLGAYWDRCVLRYKSDEIQDQANRLKMMENHLISRRPLPNITFSLDELDQAQQEVEDIDIPTAIRKEFDEKIFLGLKKEGLAISGRKINQCMNVLQAHAWLYGRSQVSTQDFLILKHVLWDDPKHISTVARVVLDAVNPIMRECQEIHDGVIAAYNKLVAGNAMPDEGSEFIAKSKEMGKKIKTMAGNLPEGNDKDEIRKLAQKIVEKISEVERSMRGGDVDLSF